MNKPIYLGLSILEISKTLMYEFWYDYMKPKYGDNVKLCYMDTDSFIMHIKTEDFYKDIANDVEKRFDTSNDEVNRPLPTGKNKKKIGLMKDELGVKIMTEFVALRPKYGDNVKLCYMDTDSFIMHIKTEDFYKDIANDVEKRFDTSNDEVNRPLPTGKNKKKIGLMKDELGVKIMTEFVALRPTTYSYLTDDCEEDKKAKGIKKCVIKRRLKFNDYKDCLLNN